MAGPSSTCSVSECCSPVEAAAASISLKAGTRAACLLVGGAQDLAEVPARVPHHTLCARTRLIDFRQLLPSVYPGFSIPWSDRRVEAVGAVDGNPLAGRLQYPLVGS